MFVCTSRPSSTTNEITREHLREQNCSNSSVNSFGPSQQLSGLVKTPVMQNASVRTNLSLTDHSGKSETSETNRCSVIGVSRLRKRPLTHKIEVRTYRYAIYYFKSVIVMRTLPSAYFGTIGYHRVQGLLFRLRDRDTRTPNWSGFR